MRRQSSFSPEHQPYSTYNNYQNDIPQNHKNSTVRESFSPVHCESCKCKGYKRNNYERCRNDIDDQTKQILSNLRQKACRFIKSDLENTTSSETSSKPCMHQHSNNHHSNHHSKEGSPIKRTQDSIDYAPDSEFLKKMKGPCQCIHANRERESFSLNSNEGNGPRHGYCEECIEKSNQVIKLLEQLKYIRMSLPFHNNSDCEGNEPPTQQEIDSSGLYQIVKTCRSVVNDLKAALASIRPFTKEDGLESGEKISPKTRNYDEGSNANSKHSKKTAGKSQHVSRGKKRLKGRVKRKKNSKEIEKRNSEEYFEPSLKMPHENCCERCWSSASRYASPARSPVNKPDQRYNPKFCMTRSCEDLLGNEFDGVEISPEIYENQVQQQNVQRDAAKKHVTGSSAVVSPSPDRGRGSTKVKNLYMEGSETQRPQSRYQVEKIREEYDNYKSPEFSETEERRRRPKTHPTGSKERTETRGRTSNLPTDSSARSTRYDPYSNSPRLREKNVDALGSAPIKVQTQSPRNADNHGSPVIKSHAIYRDRMQFDPNGNGRFDWDSTSTAYQSLEKGRNSPPFSGREYRPFVECVCPSGSNTYAARPIPSPRPQTFHKSPTRQEILPPSNVQSSVSVRNKSRSPVGRRPQTADHDAGRKARGSPMKSDETGRTYQCKCCDYRKSMSPPRPRTNSLEEPIPKKELCCHCRSFDNGRETMSPFARNAYMQSTALKQRLPTYQPQMNSAEISYPARVSYDQCKCRANSAERKEFLQTIQGHAGTTIPCPYERDESDQDYPRGSIDSGNQRRIQDNEPYSRGERRDQTDYYHCIPKKYCVFYMTKCKSDRGNVEVLVEELTEKAKVNTQKDSKTTELKDKMKKIDDNQLESMALKFQKGINASAKIPENGRILYF